MNTPSTPSPSANVHLRPFLPGDGPRIAEAWTRAAPGDGITHRRLRDQVLLDRNFDATGLLVAVAGDELLGAAYAVHRQVAAAGDDLEPDTGWIPFFFVVPEARRQGIGRALVSAAMSWLGERGARTALFSPYTPNYLLPGLDRERYPEADALLASLGFTRRYDAVAMDRSLNDHVVPADVQDLRRRREAEGYRFATPTDDDLPGLVQMAGERFNPDWARGIREAVVQGLPLERVLATWGPDGTLLGWAMCGAYEDVLERFGPFGVVPESRGTGLGKILLHLTLQRMRALGAHSAWFLWTGRETPAGYLYRGADFTVTRTFTILSAPLPPGTSGTPEDPTTGAER